MPTGDRTIQETPIGLYRNIYIYIQAGRRLRDLRRLEDEGAARRFAEAPRDRSIATVGLSGAGNPQSETSETEHQ